MNKHFILFLLVTFIIGSCASEPASPTPLITVAVTPTVIPSETPRPTQASIPTATPYPQLQTDGPYLLYSTDWRNLTILDADGKGRKQFQLPDDGFVRELKKAVSPDGNWLAYFTGSSLKEPYGLALHLFNLEDQTTFLIANLIAPGFPENLELVRTSDPVELESCTEGACRISIIQLAFHSGIESLDWSPDSQSLAFAAQIDGPSSDVYIFNVQERSIRRLVDDLENVWLIDWSPNGEKILYQNSTAGITYTSTYIHIADPNVESLQSPNVVYGGKFWYEYGWIDEGSYLFADGGEGAPPQNLRYVDIFTQQIKAIWPYEAEYLTMDSENNRIVLITPPDAVGQPKGIFSLAVDGSYKKLSDGFYYLFQQQDPSNVYFGLEGEAEKSILISIFFDGPVSSLSRQVSYYVPPRVSPDQKWVLINSDHGVELYSEKLELIKIWADISIEQIIWTPDSLGAYLIEGNEVYYLSIASGEPIKVNLCDDCHPFDYVWLP